MRLLLVEDWCVEWLPACVEKCGRKVAMASSSLGCNSPLVNAPATEERADIRNVFVLCTRNSARSQMAEALRDLETHGRISSPLTGPEKVNHSTGNTP